MKFDKMKNYQQDACKALLVEGLKNKLNEEELYTQQFFKMLLIANGSGIVLISSFINSLAKKSVAQQNLSSPLICFFIGVVSSSIIYFIFMSIANRAVKQYSDQYIQVVMNKIDIENFQGWGLSKSGVFITWVLIATSLLSFLYGTFQSINLVNAILATG